ncbi:FLYWCH zinc finger domain-containing protein [Phthorimaea operculella]|nr:FLYWCH zinc finger domain-containing protein [Phthorimaea operculella]
MNSRGFPVIILGENKFGEHSNNKRNPNSFIKRWKCTRTGCHAFVVTADKSVIKFKINTIIELKSLLEANAEELGSAAEPVYAVSKYGRPVILLGAGRYNHHKTNGQKTFWRCVKWSDGCRACLTTIDSVLVKVADNHTHYKKNTL